MIKLIVDNTAPATVADQRRGLLAKIHIARKTLGMVEDDYRAVLARITGHRSAKNCDNCQLGKVMEEFERMGFRPTSGPSRRSPASGSVARKARAMWISLYQLGAIDDASERALEAFAQRQLHVARLQWADERQGYRLIEALKAMADRHGWDQHVSARLPAPERIRLLKDRLVAAQLTRLASQGVPASGPIATDRSDWSNKRLESAAAELADRIRATAAPS